MAYSNGTPFTEAQISRLCETVKHYHASGKRPPWGRISIEIGGHSSDSCKATWYALREKNPEIDCRLKMPELRDDVLRRMTAARLPQKKKAIDLPLASPTVDPAGRPTSIARFAMDAEMRARIAVLGPNGLLGDPLPGRSALDQKRATSGVSA